MSRAFSISYFALLIAVHVDPAVGGGRMTPLRESISEEEADADSNSSLSSYVAGNY